jgi:CAAX prenyl protease-like protein
MQTKPDKAGAIAWVAPFAVFVGVMALEKFLPFSPAVLYPIRVTLSLAAILLFSRRLISWAPTQILASIALGVVVFFIWIGPDLIWSGWRHLWLFQNPILGSPSSSLPPGLKQNIPFLAIRIFGSAVLVPILEELFWRGWLMRWLISQDFRSIPLGTYTPFAFWITALLFASEHGSYWEVGLITGVIYNWWLVRTKNLPNCILAHAVTNGCLAIYVLAAEQWQYWL